MRLKKGDVIRETDSISSLYYTVKKIKLGVAIAECTHEGKNYSTLYHVRYSDPNNIIPVLNRILPTEIKLLTRANEYTKESK
jgi:hypothetical protein